MENSRRSFIRKLGLGAAAVTVLPASALALKKPSAPLACNPVTLDAYGEGPFYTANAPMISNIQLASASEVGTRLILSGVVRTLDDTKVIPNAVMDIWHANDGGGYDNVGYNLRGQLKTDALGAFKFETILPGKYLNGAAFRPRHIHLKITPPGFPTITTQLYFAGDTSIAGDAAASITSGQFDATNRIIPIALNSDGKYEGTWNTCIDGNGVVNSLNDIKSDKGIIYLANPNPFVDSLNIKYGLFNAGNVELSLFDMSGKHVETVINKEQKADVYEMSWAPKTMLASGTYWLTLKVNDLQVHYQKIVKQ